MFVILAYRESPYLEECIQSLIDQTVKTNVIAATSTSSEYLEKICAKHHIPLRINVNPAGTISDDWNYAYRTAEADYVTLAHQDDIYRNDFTERVFTGNNDFLIAFTNYYEIRECRTINRNLNLFIKRCLLLPFYIRHIIANQFIRKAVLAFGSPVCCPSVTYNKKEIANFSFTGAYSINMDWLAWLALARTPGSFKYISQPLVYHRIHAFSETSVGLKENRRQLEDRSVLQKIWGPRLGRILARIYSCAYRSNK